jgi:hypothetical protein
MSVGAAKVWPQVVHRLRSAARLCTRMCPRLRGPLAGHGGLWQHGVCGFLAGLPWR